MSKLNTTTNPSAYDGKYTVLSQVIELRKVYDETAANAAEALETANAAETAAYKNKVALEQVKTLRIGGTASVNLTYNAEDSSHSHVYGTNSLVAGQANNVSTESVNTFVSGSLNQVDGQNIIASGNLQRVDTGNNDVISGNDNNLTETSNCIISGNGNTMEYTANSFTTGQANSNSGRDSIMCGVDNVMYEENDAMIMCGSGNDVPTGENNIVAGSNNYAEFAGNSVICGNNCAMASAIVNGIVGGDSNGTSENEVSNTLIMGQDNNVSHNNCIVSGSNNITTRDNQLIVGEYANPTANTLFAVGRGSNNNTRRNALLVDVNGITTLPTLIITSALKFSDGTTLTAAQLQQLLALIQ
jgi:hypothetical protein